MNRDEEDDGIDCDWGCWYDFGKVEGDFLNTLPTIGLLPFI